MSWLEDCRNNETFAIAYRAAEANGRDWMALKGANNGDIRDYLCALTGITDNEYQTCTGKSEEVMVRALEYFRYMSTRGT